MVTTATPCSFPSVADTCAAPGGDRGWRAGVNGSVGLPPRLRKQHQSMRAGAVLLLRIRSAPEKAPFRTRRRTAIDSCGRSGNERHAVTVRVQSASPRGAASIEAEGTTRRAGPETENTTGRLAWRPGPASAAITTW